MTDEIDRVIAGLTPVQRSSLTKRAEWTCNDPNGGLAWHTFQVTPTHDCLKRKGLVESSGIITPLGLAVRARLQERQP